MFFSCLFTNWSRFSFPHSPPHTHTHSPTGLESTFISIHSVVIQHILICRFNLTKSKVNPVFTLLPDKKGLYNILCLVSSSWNTHILLSWTLNHMFTISFVHVKSLWKICLLPQKRFFRCFHIEVLVLIKHYCHFLWVCVYFILIFER